MKETSLAVVESERPPTEAVETVELPEGLRRRLREFARACRWAEFQTALASCWIAIALSVAALLVLDRFVETPVWVRGILSATGWIAAAALPLAWSYRWLWAPPDWRRLACWLQARLPEIGDRLLGAVELASAPSESVGSVTLRRAAIAQVAREMESVDFLRAVPQRPRRAATAGALALAVVAWGAVHASPELVRNAMVRWARPRDPVRRFTFVRLDGLPSEIVLPVGEPLELECRVVSRLNWLVRRASCRVVPDRGWRGTKWVEAIGPDGRVRFRIPGPTQPCWLTLRVGDAIARARLRPEQRPALVRLEARIQPPAWLGMPAYTLPVESGWVRVPEDSEVTLVGEVARPLQSAMAWGPELVPLEVEESSFRTPVFQAGRPGVAKEMTPARWLPASLFIAWRDRWGLEPAQPTRVVTEVAPDLPPVVRLEGLAESIALLEDDVVPLTVRASDEFGVRRVWLDWTVMSESWGTRSSGRKGLVDGTPDLREVTVASKLSPAAMGWPVDSMVELRAAALDHRPNRVPSTSGAVRVWVVSRAKHLQLLEEAARALDARLEELRRAEESRLVQTESLHSNVWVGAESDSYAQRAQELASSEQAGAEVARRLAEEWERLAAEALRNRDMATETLRDWVAMAERLNRVASDMMHPAGAEIQASVAAQGANARASRLASAAERQRAAVEELGRAHAQSQDSLVSLGARTLARRLGELATKEAQLSRRLAEELPKVAGVPASELPPPARSELDAVARVHRVQRKEMEAVREDLVALAQRSGSQLLQSIRHEMSEPDVTETMSRVEDWLRVNHTVRAVEQTTQLAQRIAEWARRLEPPESRAGGSTGGASGAGDSIPTEVLLGILRARVRQEALRESTRELDRQREQPDYADRARLLAAHQLDIADNLRPLADRVQNPWAGLIREVNHMMLISAAELREPDTGPEALGVQTEIIETLAAAVESAASPSAGAGALSPEAMRALARLVEQLGRAGGGSRAGGTTDTPSGPASGSVGSSPSPRGGPRGGVADPLEFPSEYRDLLEDYYHALDEP